MAKVFLKKICEIARSRWSVFKPHPGTEGSISSCIFLRSAVALLHLLSAFFDLKGMPLARRISCTLLAPNSVMKSAVVLRWKSRRMDQWSPSEGSSSLTTHEVVHSVLPSAHNKVTITFSLRRASPFVSSLTTLSLMKTPSVFTLWTGTVTLLTIQYLDGN